MTPQLLLIIMVLLSSTTIIGIVLYELVYNWWIAYKVKKF